MRFVIGSIPFTPLAHTFPFALACCECSSCTTGDWLDVLGTMELVLINFGIRLLIRDAAGLHYHSRNVDSIVHEAQSSLQFGLSLLPLSILGVDISKEEPSFDT